MKFRNLVIKALTAAAVAALVVTPVAAEELNGAEPTADAVEAVDEADTCKTGYIHLPAEDEVEMTDEDISFSEIQRLKVETEGAGSDYEPKATIPRRYPGETDAEAKSILQTKYPDVRNQGDFGTCWAHSTVGCAEFSTINQGKADKTTDLSELYLAYGIFRTQKNPIVGNDEAKSKVTFTGSDKDELNNGGNAWLTGQYLTKGIGYIPEDDLQYISSKYDSKFDSNGNLKIDIDIDELKKKSVLQLSDMSFCDITSNTGRNIAKEAIMKNGIVGVSYYAESETSKYYNKKYAAYNNDLYTKSNHQVAIVGWNDDFPSSYFASGHRPTTDGAWLVRNSWADSSDFYGVRKYFWLSYEDKSLSNAYIYEVKEKNNYDNNYYYDTQIHNWNALTSGSTVANVYTVQNNGNEKLTEVTIEVMEATDYEIKIYRNLSDDTNPVSGTLVGNAITKGKLSLPGIYTIPLDNPVLMKKGSRFSVVVTTGTKSVCYESSLSSFGEAKVVVECGAKKKQSFYKDYSGWKDWTNSAYCRSGCGNFCIGAHTVNTNETEAKEVYKDSTGQEVTVIYDIEEGTYKSLDGKEILCIVGGGEVDSALNYQYTGKAICPSKKSFIIYEGVLYTYKKDYTVSFKKNKKTGMATATIRWKKKSAPYMSGNKESKLAFNVVPRTVSDDMVSFTYSKGKVKKLQVRTGNLVMKPKKKDFYVMGVSANGITIMFTNNYQGTVTKKI